MSFFNDFFGRTSAREAQQLGQRNAAQANASTNEANRQSRVGYDASVGEIRPFAEGGRRGYDLYTNALGVNGDAARQGAFDTFQSSPFLAYARQNSGQEAESVLRRYGSRGMANSGASQLAITRAAGERANADVQNWLSHAQGLGNQGYQAANALAGLHTGHYDGVANREIQRGSMLINNDTQATMAANNARMAGVNNLLRGLGTLGGTAISAFAPGAGGMSAAGNMMSMFSPKGGGLSPGMVQVLASRGGGFAGGGSDMPAGGYLPDPRRPYA